jgi:hypothetical protein
MASRCYHGIHYLLSIDVERPGLLSSAVLVDLDWSLCRGCFCSGRFRGGLALAPRVVVNTIHNSMRRMLLVVA